MGSIRRVGRQGDVGGICRELALQQPAWEEATPPPPLRKSRISPPTQPPLNHDGPAMRLLRNCAACSRANELFVDDELEKAIAVRDSVCVNVRAVFAAATR